MGVFTNAVHWFQGKSNLTSVSCNRKLVFRQLSAFVIANIQFIKCLTLFLAPALVAIFVHDDSNKSQWRIIFYILGIFNFIVSVFLGKITINVKISEFF